MLDDLELVIHAVDDLAVFRNELVVADTIEVDAVPYDEAFLALCEQIVAAVAAVRRFEYRIMIGVEVESDIAFLGHFQRVTQRIG